MWTLSLNLLLNKLKKMNINQNTEPISINVHYGEEKRSNSLKAYKYENELKRAVAENKNVLKFHLAERFALPSYSIVKVSEVGEPVMTENFSLVELINNKLTSSNTKVCIETYEIFKEQGIVEAISSLHKISPLTVI